MIFQDKQIKNPLIRHKYTADPTVLVHHDTVYLYTGHDEAPVGTEEYVMNEWLCFSSGDLVEWKEHAVPLVATDFQWASGDAYASKVVEHGGKFLWFVAVSHKEIPGKAIGVAVADRPEGPYRDAIGAALITSEMLPVPAGEKTNLDPTVLIDDDGKSYIFWGNEQCFYAELSDDLLSLNSDVRLLTLPGFIEGAHIHKRDGWYYLSYGYEFPEKVAYAMSKYIHGPWEFQGILNEVAENCETNRAAIVDFSGRSLFFYHDGSLKDGGSHRRSVCVTEVIYHLDNTMRLMDDE